MPEERAERILADRRWFVETGNMRNTTHAALLKESAFRQQAAEAIADGLAVYLARR